MAPQTHQKRPTFLWYKLGESSGGGRGVFNFTSRNRPLLLNHSTLLQASAVNILVSPQIKGWGLCFAPSVWNVRGPSTVIDAPGRQRERPARWNQPAQRDADRTTVHRFLNYIQNIWSCGQNVVVLLSIQHNKGALRWMWLILASIDGAPRGLRGKR